MIDPNTVTLARTIHGACERCGGPVERTFEFSRNVEPPTTPEQTLADLAREASSWEPKLFHETCAVDAPQ